MKQLKFKDSKGKVHTFKNVKLFTGCRDKNGKEIYEGDFILSPGLTHVYSDKCKVVTVRNEVVVLEPDPKRKTVCGTPINNPIEIVGRQRCKTKWKSYNWSEFFDCEIEPNPRREQGRER